MTTITHKTIQTIEILGENHNGQQKRLCLVAWNDRAPVLDLRLWYGNDQPGKGMTLSQEETAALRDALIKLDLNKGESPQINTVVDLAHGKVL
jgi:hypothetical protein